MHHHLDFFYVHPLVLPIAMFIFNMAISNMPDPDANSGKLYRWAYGTLHGIVGGLGNALYAAKSGQPVPGQSVSPILGSQAAGVKAQGGKSYSDLSR